MKKNLWAIMAGLVVLMVLTVPALAEHEASSGGYTTAQWHDFFWRVANFVVFVAVLFFLLRKPVSKFFRERRENIARNLEYLEIQAKNLEEQNKVLSRKLLELSSEREALLAQYEKDGAKERDRIIEAAEKTAENIIRKTEAAMEQEINSARRLLLAEVGKLATSLAEEILVKNINSEDQNRLMHEFMEQVTKLPARN